MKYDKGSFITVPSRDVLRGIHPNAQALYMWLCAYANETGNCFPSRRTLARDTGSSEATIDRMLVLLCEKGLLKKKHQKQDGVYTSNLYTVLVAVRPLTQSPPSPPTESTVPSDVRTNSTHLTQTIEPGAFEDEQRAEPIEISYDSEEENVRQRKAPKNTPEMLAGYEIFDDQPARKTWKLMELERESMKALLQEYGHEKLVKRYSAVKKYRGEQWCPLIKSPSTFLQLMPNLERFIKNLES